MAKETKTAKKKAKLIEPNTYWQYLEMESKYTRDY